VAVPLYFEWATFGANFTLLSTTPALQVDFHN
jgi:hypothetical protein